MLTTAGPTFWTNGANDKVICCRSVGTSLAAGALGMAGAAAKRQSKAVRRRD
jgi:hypothetical protein